MEMFSTTLTLIIQELLSVPLDLISLTLCLSYLPFSTPQVQGYMIARYLALAQGAVDLRIVSDPNGKC
jgi:hypothetical protein